MTGNQRFGGALNLNIHLHALVLDGVYIPDPTTGALRFRRLPPPSLDDLDEVLSRARPRILSLLAAKGYPVDPKADDETELPDETSVFDEVQAASIQDAWFIVESSIRL